MDCPTCLDENERLIATTGSKRSFIPSGIMCPHYSQYRKRTNPKDMSKYMPMDGLLREKNDNLCKLCLKENENSYKHGKAWRSAIPQEGHCEWHNKEFSYIPERHDNKKYTQMISEEKVNIRKFDYNIKKYNNVLHTQYVLKNNKCRIEIINDNKIKIYTSLKCPLDIISGIKPPSNLGFETAIKVNKKIKHSFILHVGISGSFIIYEDDTALFEIYGSGYYHVLSNYGTMNETTDTKNVFIDFFKNFFN